MKARRLLHVALAVSLLSFGVPACDGDVMTVGAGPQDKAPVPVGQPEVWTGYIELYKFASGSDRVSIAFTAGNAAGTVSLGEPAPATPAPVDPAKGYPAWLTALRAGDPFWQLEEDSFTTTVQRNSERFSFTMRDLATDGARRRFKINLVDVWTPWCAAQTSYAPPGDPKPGVEPLCSPFHAGSRWGPPDLCEVDLDLNPVDAVTEPSRIDCGKLLLCERAKVCQCDVTRCFVSPYWIMPLSFDIRFEGARADGSCELGAVHLTRQ